MIITALGGEGRGDIFEIFEHFEYFWMLLILVIINRRATWN